MVGEEKKKKDCSLIYTAIFLICFVISTAIEQATRSIKTSALNEEQQVLRKIPMMDEVGQQIRDHFLRQIQFRRQ